MANGCAQIVNCASGYLDFHFHFLLPFIFLLKNICTGKMSPKKTGNYDPDFLKEKFSHFFKFSLHERNWDRKKVEPFCKTEVIEKKPFETWQFGKFGVLVTFFVAIFLVWWKFKGNEGISFSENPGLSHECNSHE